MNKPVKIALVSAGALAAVGLVAAVSFAFRLRAFAVESRAMPAPTLGVVNGALTPCGPKPNCALETGLALPPPDRGPIVEAARRALEEMGVRITVNQSDYVRGEATTKLWGFVDDIEIYSPPGATTWSVRSQSRVGHSDLGANAARIKELKRRLGLVSG